MGYQLPNINEFVSKIRRKSEEETQKKIRRVENSYLAVQLLAGEGVFVNPNEWDTEYGEIFEVDVKDLPAIRRALGRLKKAGSYPTDNVRKKEIFVQVNPVDDKFKHFGFKYKTKLPKGAKCKIVTTRERRTYRNLVCEA